MLVEMHIPRENSYHALGIYVNLKMQESFQRSFDIFFELISPTVWQSPHELGGKWIERVCPNEWRLLQDIPHEPIGIRKEKEEARRMLLHQAARSIFFLSENTTLLQQMTTRLLVRKIGASVLPVPDQDRIFSKEFQAKYHTWKAFFATLVAHEVLSDERIMSENPYFYIDTLGEDASILTFDGHIRPIDGLEEAPMHYDQMLVESNTDSTVKKTQKNITKILLTPSLLRWHQDILLDKEMEKKTRKKIHEKTGGIPAFKKRAFGNKSEKFPLELTPKIELT